MQIALTEAEAKYMHDLLRSASSRKSQGEFVLEGAHLIEEAIKFAPELIKTVVFTPSAEEHHSDLMIAAGARRVKIRTITERLSRRISETEQPQGIYGILNIPHRKLGISQIILALDGVQDPGNTGTLIRTARWFGVTDILLGPGTADPYAPKVVRSTQGAILAVNIEQCDDLAERIRELKREKYHCLVTALDPKATSLYKLSRMWKSVVVLGSEAHGVSAEIRHLADTTIMIPAYGTAESLNVAVSGGIVLSELVRKLG